MPVAGWPRSSRQQVRQDVVDTEDGGLTAPLPRRLAWCRSARPTRPEYGITGTTESAALGPLPQPLEPGPHRRRLLGRRGRAPWRPASCRWRTASDGLGSIRIPAACCGLVGLKVTRDRNPNLPDGYDYAFGIVVDHVVSRTVRDSAAMLDATGYPEPDSPYPAPPKDRPYLEEVSREPRQAAHRLVETAQLVGKAILAPLLRKEVDAIYLVYNEFKSAMCQLSWSSACSPSAPAARRAASRGGGRPRTSSSSSPTATRS